MFLFAEAELIINIIFPKKISGPEHESGRHLFLSVFWERFFLGRSELWSSHHNGEFSRLLFVHRYTGFPSKNMCLIDFVSANGIKLVHANMLMKKEINSKHFLDSIKLILIKMNTHPNVQYDQFIYITSISITTIESKVIN